MKLKLGHDKVKFDAGRAGKLVGVAIAFADGMIEVGIPDRDEVWLVPMDKAAVTNEPLSTWGKIKQWAKVGGK